MRREPGGYTLRVSVFAASRCWPGGSCCVIEEGVPRVGRFADAYRCLSGVLTGFFFLTGMIGLAKERTMKHESPSLVLAVLAAGGVFFFGVGSAEVQAVSVSQLSVDDAAVRVLRSIATDGATLYMTGEDPSTTNEGVFTMSIAGGPISHMYNIGAHSQGVTLVGSEVFWTDEASGPITDTEIFRAPKDGSGPVTTIYTGALVGEPIVDAHDVVTDGTKLYTSDRVQGRVQSLDFDGTGITQLASRFGGFFDRNQSTFIAHDAGTLYVADEGRAGFPDTPPRVQKLSTGGGEVVDLFVGSLPGFSPQGLTVGDGTLFLTHGSDILTLPTSGGTPTFLVSDPSFGELRNLTFHEDALYVVGDTVDSEPGVWRVDLSRSDGPCDDSVFIAGGGSSCAPLIAGLVGGPAAAGLLDLTLDPEDPEVTEDTTLLDAVASATEGAHLALLRMDVGPAGYDEVHEGFDMLLLVNLTDAPLGSPALGIDPEELDTEFMVPLTTGFEVKEELSQLPAHSVYALLIPEDGTIFNLSYTAEVDGEMVDVVASGLRVETDGRSFIPEPGVLGALGAGLLALMRKRRRWRGGGLF